MDQKEIDALIRQSQGSIDEFNKKQEQLIKNLTEKKEPESPNQPPASSSPAPSAAAPPPQQKSHDRKKGKVMGQLSRVTEEAEAGTNMVMGFLENVLTLVSRQQEFVRDILAKYREKPQYINVDEVLNFINDNFTLIEDNIFNAMDAFQFQDIGRQKLMKVMYTLARLNEYLNELLSGEEDKEKSFGRNIEKKTLEQDKHKDHVDGIVSQFQNGASVASPAPAPTSPSDDTRTVSNDEVADLVAQYQQQTAAPAKPEPPKEETGGSQTVSNDEVADLVAQYQKQNPTPMAQPAPPASAPPASGNQTVSNDDVNDIVAQFQAQQVASTPPAQPAPPPAEKPAPGGNQIVSNEDMDAIIAEFNKQNKA